MSTTWRLAVAGVAAVGMFAAEMSVLGAPAAAQQLDQAVSEAEDSTAAAAAAQERIDRLADETGDLFREYRAVLQRIANQRLYVEQQRVYLDSQQNEIADLQRQITEVEDVLRNLLPMQFEMISTLDAFVRADIPFLRDERLDRVDRLRALMDNPAVAPAERYRQIVDTYQVEADYGRFLRTWSAPLNENPLSDVPPDETAPNVDYLLIGRVAFVYMSQDQSDLAIWNTETGAWEQLDGSHRGGVRDAIRMARETLAPNVFVGPVPGATPVDAAE
ncbi:MAG: DUF3450 domain-containing protein [Maricaulaceae bacterium]|jgi:hypothetical protein